MCGVTSVLVVVLVGLISDLLGLCRPIGDDRKVTAMEVSFPLKIPSAREAKNYFSLLK